MADRIPFTSKYQSRRPQRGAITIEFALMLMLGLLPLLLLTYTGVMLLAAQQSLSLASAEGARASLLHGTDAERRSAACMAAERSMRWLLDFSGRSANCAAPPATGAAMPVTVSAPVACSGNAQARCIHVVTRYDYDTHPFIPGVGRMYGWMLGGAMSSTAIAQVDAGD